MLIHLFITFMLIAAYFSKTALTNTNQVLSFLSAILFFSLGMVSGDLAFIWINDVGTVITYHWDNSGYLLYLFWGFGIVMLLIGFFQAIGYTMKNLEVDR